jgi:hypothetical protein
MTNEQQQKEKELLIETNLNSPAFPPDVQQDTFGRILASIPGMTKLEYACIQLLPETNRIWKEYKGLVKCNDKACNSNWEFCYETAKSMLTYCIQKQIESTQTQKNQVQIV